MSPPLLLHVQKLTYLTTYLILPVLCHANYIFIYSNICKPINYINKLTKGFTVTKFNMQGKYWHGYEGIEYRKRKATALEKASMPIDPQVSITGAKNTIR